MCNSIKTLTHLVLPLRYVEATLMQLDRFMRIFENIVQFFFIISICIILLALSNGFSIENVLVLQQQIDQPREHPFALCIFECQLDDELNSLLRRTDI